MSEELSPEQKADAFVLKITLWETIKIQGQLGNQIVDVIQMAQVRGLSGNKNRLVKTGDDRIFLWAGDVTGPQFINEALENRLLITWGECWMSIAEAFKPGNEWVW